MSATRAHPPSEVESRYAWLRLFTSLALMTIGGSGHVCGGGRSAAGPGGVRVARSVASLPYTLTMVGFGLGGILMGRLSDRFGVIVPVLLGAVSLGVGFIAAGAAPGLLVFALAQGLLIGFLGSSATFAPLVADTSLWFTRRRGIAVAICVSGNYLAGRAVAARAAVLLRQRRLAHDLHRRRRILLAGDAAARAGAAPAGASARHLGERCGRTAGLVDAARHGARHAAVLALRRRRGLLRGDVDAPGAHRRLLRRSRLCRGARRRNAVADARLRHCQPAGLGLDLGSHRRPADAPARLQCCRESPCSCSCRSTGSPRCT